jgi:predicted DNA-binding protein with PD1-like motif
MKFRKAGEAYVLRLERGERIIEALTDFCAREGIRAGSFDGLGTCRNAELGFFHIDAGTYEYRIFPGDCEIASLVGNVSRLDGAPRIHAHIVLGDSAFRSWSGHLKEAEVLATCEIVLRPLDGDLGRTRDGDTGLTPLDI